MRLTWYGHACFRLEGSGLSVVTDPYTPGAELPNSSGLPPIEGGPPDVILMSSAEDPAHSSAESVPGGARVVNALDAVTSPIPLSGSVEVTGFATREGDDRPDDPSDNAMYLLTLDGVSVCHMGDIGIPLTGEHLSALAGRVDVLLALAGGGLTIALDDLDEAIDAIGPRVVVPMHYRIPGLRYNVGPIEDFLAHRRYDKLVTVDGSSFDVTVETLPTTRTTVVLEPLVVNLAKAVPS